jgi:hypothetical protein
MFCKPEAPRRCERLRPRRDDEGVDGGDEAGEGAEDQVRDPDGNNVEAVHLPSQI